MKTVKPNLKKMFNFHTIILVMLVIVVSTLNTHNAEGKFQTLHKHHHHKHNYKHDNVLGDSDDESNEDSDKQHELYSQHGHHNQHHHSHHHHHHNQQQQQLQQHLYATTPSLEFTTSSSLPSVSPGQVNGDNEFLIKPQQQQEELPLTNKDEIYYKTKELKSSSSTTSKPTLSIHLMKLHNHNPKSSNSNSSSKHSGTSTNSQREHTHLGHYNRLIPTPLTTPEGKSGIDNNRSQNTATLYTAVAQENENSKWKLAAKDEDTKNINEQAAVVHEKLQSHNEQKPDFHNDRRRPQHNYDDYYSDAEDGDDDDDENDVDDEYSEDEGDNDGISYDDDNKLSDRSYARITRSKLDDDYIDDEPYRNELSMQRDAAPGVLTEQKYMDVGNEKAVQQARERYMQEQKRPRTPHELATEHWHRMIQATKCRKPLPRVIPVSNNTSKRYEPYATILHRCGDDTGCCGSTASVCTVKRHEIVMVYVFSYDFNYRKEIEALPMQNHTECHCVNRGSLLHDYMPRDKRSGGSGSYLHHFQRQQKKQQEQQQQYRQSQPQQPLQYHHHQQQLQNMLDCHCPRHFNVFEEDVERHVHLPKPHSVFIRKCRCDCLVNNQTCLRFKHGEEGFSLEDRKCILDRNCKPPVCSNGEYNSRVGRCPSYRSHLLQMT